MNKTMIQYFHWYTKGEGTLWNELNEKAEWLASIGITAAWLPPAYKAAAGSDSVGYNGYDLYDLGEFDQKGSVKTKYGSKEEYKNAVKSLQKNNIEAIIDIVLNHKGGGDETEKFMAVRVDSEDRNKIISEPEEIEAFTKFTFPARATKHSEFIWTQQCFTGVDYNHLKEETAIFSIQNEWGNDWEEMIDIEKGNYDYLMFNDIEFRNPAVRDELNRWIMWHMEEIPFDAVRLDAVKHISPKFYNEWLHHLREKSGKEIFAVGEYWAPGLLPLLLRYIEATEGKMSLFDSALQNNFHIASNEGSEYDLRNIFNETLTQALHEKSVTLVDNHDTQPLQSLEAPVEKWFKPLAYAFILLRQNGYPCIFYPDLFGATYKDSKEDGNEYEIFLDKIEELETLLKARKHFAYGLQRDYFDDPNCIGWIREGDDENAGCAIIISNADANSKSMEIGKKYAGKTFIDLLKKQSEEIIVSPEGWIECKVMPGSVSVWVDKEQISLK